MSDMKTETLLLHAGWRADETTGSVAVPITKQPAINSTIRNTRLAFLPFRARKYLHPHNEPDQ